MKRIDELEKALLKEQEGQKVRVIARDPADNGLLVCFERPVGKLLVKSRGGEIRGTKFSAPVRRELEKLVLDHKADLSYARV